MTADDYRAQLRALLPRGLAWTCEPGGILDGLMMAIADGLARLHGAAAALIDEVDPRSTTALLADWERVTGLTAGGLTTAQRRAAVLAQLRATGGQAPSYFVSVAASLGYTVMIAEFRPHTVESDVDYPLWEGSAAFRWHVQAVASAGAATTEALETLLRTLAPAHTIVTFEYL